MSEVVSFTGYVPPARFDDNPWTQARIDEAASASGPWVTIDTVDLDPIDSDPSDPGEQSFTTPNGTAPDLWYRVTFLDDASGLSIATTPAQNTTGASTPYATTDDLFRVLKITRPTDAQIRAAQGDLDTATFEINSEIDLSPDHDPLGSEELELCRGVCIDRAADLWRHRESAPGILGVVDESMPSSSGGRYSFARYTARLSVLKDRWGVA